MVHFLTEPADIREAQAIMLAAFRRGVEPRLATISYRGGRPKRKVYWHQQHAFWGSLNAKPPSEKGAGRRFWNAFGTQDPDHSDSLFIVCEVNPSHRTGNRQVSGFLGVDKAGRTILLHKGLLHSGKPGLTMEFFWQHLNPEKVKSVGIDGDPYAVVCKIGSSRMVADMAKFVFEAQRIKKLHNDRSGSR